MRQFLNITKALADESRVRVLLALRGGERCVCELIELLDLAPSTVSKHMAILTQAGLTVCRKEGRWHYYRLPAPAEDSPPIRATLEWIEAMAGRCPTARQDLKRLKGICRKSKEEAGSCAQN